MKNLIRLAPAFFPACILVISACKGIVGDDDTGLPFRAADVNSRSAITATGGSPPDVSASEAGSDQQAIVGSFNTGHMSTVIEVFWDGSVQTREGSCSTDWCRGVEELYQDSTFTPIMTKNQVRLARSTHRESLSDGGVDTTLGYGGWMDHSLFAVYVLTQTYDGGSFVNGVDGYSVALGNAPKTNPHTGPFVWNGVMVGRNSDIGSANVSNVVQGDASVTAELSGAGGMSVDVTFSNIKDLNNGGSMADMTWTDLAVVDGSFDGGTIEGSFFGPQHDEVAGAFDQSRVVGAFGARR